MKHVDIKYLGNILAIALPERLLDPFRIAHIWNGLKKIFQASLNIEDLIKHLETIWHKIQQHMIPKITVHAKRGYCMYPE